MIRALKRHYPETPELESEIKASSLKGRSSEMRQIQILNRRGKALVFRDENGIDRAQRKPKDYSRNGQIRILENFTFFFNPRKWNEMERNGCDASVYVNYEEEEAEKTKIKKKRNELR